MRTYFFLLFFFLLISLYSCELDETAESTPQLFFPLGSIVKFDGDTITKITKNDKVAWNEYALDTVFVSDSIIYFSPMVYAGSGSLVEFSVTESNQETVELVWNRELIDPNIIIDSSDYSTGVFYLHGTEKSVDFPFEFKPLSEDKEFKLDFKVTSDASSRFSEYNLVLKIPIKTSDE